MSVILKNTNNITNNILYNSQDNTFSSNILSTEQYDITLANMILPTNRFVALDEVRKRFHLGNEWGSESSNTVFTAGFEDPTYLTFKIEFGDWGYSLLNIDEIAALQETNKFTNTYFTDYDQFPMGLLNANYIDFGGSYNWADQNAYNTYNYLMNRNEDSRAAYIKTFVNGLYAIQKDFPYIFLKISGLDKLQELNAKRGSRLQDAKIVLECIEGIDLKIKTLFEAYRKAAYDDVWQRWILPDIYRNFKMIIYVFDRRILLTGHGTYSLELNDFPIYAYECSPCEFDISPNFESEYSVDYINNSNMSNSRITISVKNVKTYYANALFNKLNTTVKTNWFSDLDTKSEIQDVTYTDVYNNSNYKMLWMLRMFMIPNEYRSFYTNKITHKIGDAGDRALMSLSNYIADYYYPFDTWHYAIVSDSIFDIRSWKDFGNYMKRLITTLKVLIRDSRNGNKDVVVNDLIKPDYHTYLYDKPFYPIYLDVHKTLMQMAEFIKKMIRQMVHSTYQIGYEPYFELKDPGMEFNLDKAFHEFIKPIINELETKLEFVKPNTDLNKLEEQELISPIINVDKVDTSLISPILDTSKADMQLVSPLLDASVNNMTMIEPIMNIDKADMDMAELDMNLDKSTLKLISPILDTSIAIMEMIEPVMNLDKANMDMVEPVMNLDKANIEMIEPIMNLGKADMDMISPVVNIIKPDMDMTTIIEDISIANMVLAKPVMSEYDSSMNLVVPINTEYDSSMNLIKPVINTYDTSMNLVNVVDDSSHVNMEFVKFDMTDEHQQPGNMIKLVTDSSHIDMEFVKHNMTDEHQGDMEFVKPVISIDHTEMNMVMPNLTTEHQGDMEFVNPNITDEHQGDMQFVEFKLNDYTYSANLIHPFDTSQHQAHNQLVVPTITDFKDDTALIPLVSNISKPVMDMIIPNTSTSVVDNMNMTTVSGKDVSVSMDMAKPNTDVSVLDYMDMVYPNINTSVLENMDMIKPNIDTSVIDNMKMITPNTSTSVLEDMDMVTVIDKDVSVNMDMIKPNMDTSVIDNMKMTTPNTSMSIINNMTMTLVSDTSYTYNAEMTLPIISDNIQNNIPMTLMIDMVYIPNKHMYTLNDYTYDVSMEYAKPTIDVSKSDNKPNVYIEQDEYDVSVLMVPLSQDVSLVSKIQMLTSLTDADISKANIELLLSLADIIDKTVLQVKGISANMKLTDNIPHIPAHQHMNMTKIALPKRRQFIVDKMLYDVDDDALERAERALANNSKSNDKNGYTSRHRTGTAL